MKPPSKLPSLVIAWRTAHALIAVGFLTSIAYIWWCAISGRRGSTVARAAVPILGAVAAAGVAVLAIRSRGRL